MCKYPLSFALRKGQMEGYITEGGVCGGEGTIKSGERGGRRCNHVRRGRDEAKAKRS